MPISVTKVAFQPGDRKTFLTVCLHEAQLWSSETLERVGKPMSLTSSAPDALDGKIFDACFSPDGSLILLSGSVGKKLPHESGEVRLYETATGKVKGTISSKDKPFRRAVFSDDGLLMATASDTVAQIWSVATQQPVGAELKHTGTVTALAFSPDGRTLATGNVVRAREALTRSIPIVHGGQARLWDVPSGDPLTLPIAHPSGQIMALAFSPKGQLLLTGCIDGHARLFSTVTGDQVGNRMFNAGNVCVVRFTRDGRLVLTAANGNSARLWEIPPEEGIAVNLPVNERVTALCYSADGTSLLCCTDPGVARIWDPARREFRKSFAQGTVIHEAAFRPDGDLLLSRGNGVVQKWNATSAQLLAQCSPGEEDWHPKISPDRTRVASYSAGQVHRMDVSTGRAVAPPFRVSGAKVGVDWDFDSNALFTTSKTGPVERRESSTGRVLSRLPAEVGSRFLAVSPDGRTLLTRSPDETLVHRWSVEEGRSLGSPLAHDGFMVHSASFSPDGQFVMTCGEDGAARLWDVVTGKPLGLSVYRRYAAYMAAFRPDGQEIVIGRNKSMQFVQMPAPMGGTLAEVQRRIEASTGLVADADGLRK